VLVGPRLESRRIASAAATVPVVVIARPMRTAGVDTIVNDERTGAELVVRHLAGLGHRRILHIDGGTGAGAEARRSGYERAMRAHGLAAEIRVMDGDYTDVAGARAATAVLESGDLPTAVFAANDVVAVGAIDRFEAAGLVVPDDLSVVGYDNTFLAALHHVSLTTVNQPRADMGRLATHTLVDRIRHGRGDPTRTLAAPTLVVRATTAPPRAPTTV
jgi:DNA-binding LacI/PurR family transcriptional regulator